MGGRLSSAIWTQSRITDLLSSGETDIFFSSPGMYFKRPCRGREIGGGEWMIVSVHCMKRGMKTTK